MQFNRESTTLKFVNAREIGQAESQNEKVEKTEVSVSEKGKLERKLSWEIWLQNMNWSNFYEPKWSRHFSPI